MKNWINFRWNQGTCRNKQGYSDTSIQPVSKQAKNCTAPGSTQESYVNPKYLGTGIVTNISNISSWGLWC
ncbi:MAG: hypothetical protein WCJ26_07300 [bacterium]